MATISPARRASIGQRLVRKAEVFEEEHGDVPDEQSHRAFRAIAECEMDTASWLTSEFHSGTTGLRTPPSTLRPTRVPTPIELLPVCMEHANG